MRKVRIIKRAITISFPQQLPLIALDIKRYRGVISVADRSTLHFAQPASPILRALRVDIEFLDFDRRIRFTSD